MIYIYHRINTIEQLEKVPVQAGVELDVRYHENDLILHHDPFHHHEQNPIKFEEFLMNWGHEGPIVLNVKTEGVEKKCIELMATYNISNWFFLDLSMPYFVMFSEYAQKGQLAHFSSQNLAVRFSEREPIEYACSFSGRVQWVWVDCFTRFPLTVEYYDRLKADGFKLCIVSPELHHHPLSRIPEFKALLEGFDVDAVCTKRPDLWE